MTVQKQNDDAVKRLLPRLRDAAVREHFPAFLQKSFATVSPGQDYVGSNHLHLIGEYLAACARGEIKRLIINLPPRALKSITVSVAWPAFLLGHDASRRILCASYAQGLSLKHSLDCRAVLQSRWYQRIFRETRLQRGENEKHKYLTTQRGMRYATSVGGSITGEGGDILIVDDPISALWATHRPTRRMVNEWFDHSFITRLDHKQRGVVVVVMQRLHDEDLSGYLLAKGGWEHLCLPAIAERDERLEKGSANLCRKRGEPLQPIREPVSVLMQLKRDMGSTNFAAQYQQQPVPEDGQMIRREWFRRFDLAKWEA